jgi:alkylhydroperoxidase family enzyme
MTTRKTAAFALLIAGVASTAAAPGPSATIVSVATLAQHARDRIRATPRRPLDDARGATMTDAMRLYGPTLPNYLRVFGDMPQMVEPYARLVETFLFKGVVPADVKAAMGLRIAQVNDSPYVAAHMVRLLRGAPQSAALMHAFATNTFDGLTAPQRLAIGYAESLTREIHAVSDDDFAVVSGLYNDSEIVELTMTVSFFNYLTRFAEALRLPVEAWALDTSGPPIAPAPKNGRARVALISDQEMAATAEARAALGAADTQRNGLNLGVIANSQRAMMRTPELAAAWRTFGAASRERETVDREIKLQVSFAVSMENGCRYCTLHQVLGLRRLGVDPGKLVSMKRDDSMLTPRELAAVRFARQVTVSPAAVADADYSTLRGEFGEVGAFEVLLQTCNFAFMNRLTDGLRLPSEDEAVRVYLETYGSAFTTSTSPQR